MTSRFRLILPPVLIAALIAPLTAQAQNRASSGTPVRSTFLNTTAEIPPSQTSPPRATKAVVIGAVIGAGAALALTAAGASRYGENEGGEFCSPCMLQWSLVSVPVGAAIGASIGYGVHRARRSVTATPLITRRSAGVMVFARF